MREDRVKENAHDLRPDGRGEDMQEAGDCIHVLESDCPIRFSLFRW